SKTRKRSCVSTVLKAFTLTLNSSQFPENFFSWHASCSKGNRHAWMTQSKGRKCPRRHPFSERRLPLRQPPAEQPFSASPRTWNPASNGWVLPRLGPINSGVNYSSLFPPRRDWALSLFKVNRNCSRSDRDGFCHFDGDVFCLFDPISAQL